MYIVIFTSLVCLFLTYLDSIGLYRRGLSVSFFLLTIIAAIHYDYGNDYMVYYDLYKTSTYYPFDYKAIIDGDYKDYGWVFLCYFFKPFGGFFTMVAVLSIIQNYLVYRFIKMHVCKSWWPMSIFVYLFLTNYYLLNLSMLRQGFIICVFLGLWTYIRDKKWWIPLIVLLLCSTIHTSSKILIPFSFWGFVPTRNNKIIALIYGLLLLLLLLSGSFINSLLDSVLQVEEFYDYAMIYDDDQYSVTFGLGYILGLIPFIVAVYYLLSTRDNNANIQIVMIAMLSSIITPFTSVIPLLGRVGLYFGVFQMCTIPLTFNSIKKREIRASLLLLWMSIHLFSYWMFFNNSIYMKSYRDFHTIFDVL